MIDVASIDDLGLGQMLKVNVGESILCLINIDNKIYVLDDRCSHADFSLSEGTLDIAAKEVECPKHGALFDIETGNALCLPATRPVETYNAHIVGDRIMVEIEQRDT